MLQKKIDGTYCVSDVVSDSKSKTIWITSARIQKKHQDLDNNIVSTKATSKNALGTSDIIISQGNINVNSENSDLKESSAQQTENVQTDMSKAAVGSQVPNTDNSPQPTSETPLNSSSAYSDIVTQDSGNVNKKRECF